MSEEHVMDLELTQRVLNSGKKCIVCVEVKHLPISMFFEKNKITICGLVGNYTTVVWII